MTADEITQRMIGALGAARDQRARRCDDILERAERYRHGAALSALARVTAERDALRAAASALLADVHQRYPGEQLRCPLMQALEKACKQ